MTDTKWTPLPWFVVHGRPAAHCSVGSVACSCGGWIGILDVHDEQAATCPNCGKRYILTCFVEVAEALTVAPATEGQQ